MVDPEDAVTLPLPLPHPTKLRFAWHSRFYTAVLDQSMFGQWTLTRSWGSPKHRCRLCEINLLGKTKVSLLDGQTIYRRREQHGWQWEIRDVCWCCYNNYW